MEKLKEELSKIGLVEIIKCDYVFTLLLTGVKLSNIDTVMKIQKLVLDFAGAKFPTIETLKNTDTFFCIVLKPRLN